MRLRQCSSIMVLNSIFSLGNAQLPYNPTSIFSTNTNSLYIFQPGPDTSHQLLFLNISSSVFLSNLSLEVVTSSLPFQTNGSAAYLPTISPSGTLQVFEGSCNTSTSAGLWTFADTIVSTGSRGTWRNATTTTASDITSATLPGANLLAKAFDFSNYVDGNATNTNFYVFGGMCPKDSATTATWQSEALYSNSMLRLSPAASSYTIDFTSSRGPPIAEAGFTITGLTPTYFNNSKPATQQRNYVLVGGHTQSAFINMSQVAIFSLPEETYSFVTVDAPSASNANTELAVKSIATSVDSRSGHTSVLTEDGTRLIIFGGWVGDITQAADPQLAIMELGTGFGGTGNWQWMIPTKQPSGSGLYGHGAFMLPGNVMMILGGYNISGSADSKRDVSAASPMFFNATSFSWVSSYTNPAYVTKTLNQAAQASAAAKSKKSETQKIALSVGLGLGLGAIVIAILAVCCYKRHERMKLEDEREKHIQSLSAGQAQYYSPYDEQTSSFPWSNNKWNKTRGSHDNGKDFMSGAIEYESLDTGVHGPRSDVPSPPRQISRKPLHPRSARGRYQPTPDFNFTPTHNGKSNSLGTAGLIHPIYEADEDDRVSVASDNEIGVAMGEPPVSANSKSNTDPFRDPPRHDSESPARSREREIQEWVTDWEAADVLMNSQARFHSSAGRVSPSRRAQLIAAASNAESVSGEEDSGRTTSNLSERSVAISAMTISRSGSSSQGRSRSNSLRGFVTNAMSPFSGTILSTTVASTRNSPTFDNEKTAPGSSGSSNTFTTAHTSFGVLQAEAETLLPRPSNDSGWQIGENSPTRSSFDRGSPSKIKPLQRRGWLGSIRRAITGEGNSPPASYGSRTPSPIRIAQIRTLQPRRTVSAGATLWRRKQGRGDWEDSEDVVHRSASGAYQRSAVLEPSMGGEEEEDWDVERAVENRVVQVMFTVPKEKLRVVNHDFTEEDFSEVGSIRSVKGKGMEREGEFLPLEKAEEGKGKENERATVADNMARGRVQDIVEKIEGLSTPEKSPER